MNSLKVFEKEGFGKIEVIERDGIIWFVAKEICDCLDIQNSRDAIARLDDDEKGVTLCDTRGGKQKISIINERGLYELINTSNKKSANFKYKLIDLFQSLGFFKEISFKTRGEVEFSEALQKSLEYNRYTVINQYAVIGYKIDMFIPEINVAIEYDEKAHKYQKESDAKRENEIKDLIGCEFIRIDEQDGLFYNLGKVISMLTILNQGGLQ